MIFNTHSHINDKIEEIPELLKECKEYNVSYIAVVGYDYKSSFNALSVAKNYNGIYAICGLQPGGVDEFDGNFDDFIKLFEDPSCVAIGEIGLDYYYGKDNKELQLKYFEEQLKIASKIKKPIAIHCRDAHEDTYNLLEKYHKELDGIILHCYTGSVEMMQRYLSLGAYISISGVVTFKNAKRIKDVVKACPLNRLLVETDDPYLTPVPFRGKENHPAFVYYVVKEIAELKEIAIEDVIKETSNNAKKVFHI